MYEVHDFRALGGGRLADPVEDVARLRNTGVCKTNAGFPYQDHVFASDLRRRNGPPTTATTKHNTINISNNTNNTGVCKTNTRNLYRIITSASPPCPRSSKLKRKRRTRSTESGVYFARRSTRSFTSKTLIFGGGRGPRVVAYVFGAGVYFANTGIIIVLVVRFLFVIIFLFIHLT